MRAIIIVKVVVAVLLGTPVSWAGITDIIGIGHRSMGMGSANTLVDAKAFSAKGNPASLALQKEAQVSVGHIGSFFNVTRPHLQGEGGPGGTERSTSSSGLSAAPADSGKKNVQNAVFGLALPLSRSLALGVTGLLPMGTLVKLQTFAGNESSYLFFDEKQQRPEIYSALSYRPFPFLSIGGGIFYSVAAKGNVGLGISNEDAESRISMEVAPIYVPYFGALFQTSLQKGQLLLGAFYRSEHAADAQISIDTRFTFELGTLPVGVNSQLITFYDPAMVGLGLGYKKSKYEVYLSTEAQLWSRYRPPVVNLDGEILRNIRGGTLERNPIALRDVYIFRVGGEIKELLSSSKLAVSLRGGSEFHTSVLPNRPANLAILDSERFVYNLGVGLDFKGLKNITKHPFTLDFGVKFLDLRDKVLSSQLPTDQTLRVGGNVFSVHTGLSFEI